MASSSTRRVSPLPYSANRMRCLMGSAAGSAGTLPSRNRVVVKQIVQRIGFSPGGTDQKSSHCLVISQVDISGQTMRVSPTRDRNAGATSRQLFSAAPLTVGQVENQAWTSGWNDEAAFTRVRQESNLGPGSVQELRPESQKRWNP